jgi:hypothetical protein
MIATSNKLEMRRKYTTFPNCVTAQLFRPSAVGAASAFAAKAHQPGNSGNRAAQRGPTEAGIAGEERAIQRLSQSHVSGVIGTQVVAQLPDPVEHRERAMPGNAEAAIALKKIPSRTAVQLPPAHPTHNASTALALCAS